MEILLALSYSPLRKFSGSPPAAAKTNRYMESSESSQVEIDAHTERVRKLQEEIQRAIAALMRFLYELTLMIFLALLRVLPFFLRALSVVAWIAGMGYVAVQTFQLYHRISTNPVGSALVCIMFTAIVAVIPALFDFNDMMWGGYVFAALFGYGLGRAAGDALIRIELFPLIAVLPQAIAVVGLIALACSKNKGFIPEEEKHV